MALLVLSSGASAALQPTTAIALIAPTSIDPIAAGRQLVDTAAFLGAVPADQAARARAALDLASVAARDDVTQSGIVEAAASTLAAQNAAPSTLADAHWAARMLAAAEGAQGPLSVDAKLALAETMAGDVPIPSDLAIPTLTHHKTLAEALDDLLATYPHGALTPAQQTGLARVLASPISTQRALTILIDAHLEQLATAKLALPLGDSALMAQQREHLVAAVRQARPLLAIQASDCLPNECSDASLLICGVVGLDLVGVDTTWPNCFIPLNVDIGGNDHYYNNAGGATFRSVAPTQAALAVDLSGNDEYDSLRGSPSNGAAWDGSGALFDLMGDDLYTIAPVEAWDIDFPMNAAVLDSGSALLVDLAGNDAYVTGRTGAWIANGAAGAYSTAARDAAALLFDGGGDDRYEAYAFIANGAVRGSVEIVTATSTGAFTHAQGAVAALVDLGGADLYSVLGTPSDIQANDMPSMNMGSAHGGAGILIDAGANDDHYDSSIIVESDILGYPPQTPLSMGGADKVGVGILADDGGDNTFHVAWAGFSLGSASSGPVARVSSGDPSPWMEPSLGALLSGEGNDMYESTASYWKHDTFQSYQVESGFTQGVGDHHAIGLMVDQGGTNSYVTHDSGTPAYAQGVGVHGGVGLIVDRGSHADFSLDDRYTGQGAGIPGVGMIVQTKGDTVTNYASAAGSVPSVTTGGGIGLRLNRGAFAFLGSAPDFHCTTGSLEIAGTDSVTVLGQRTVEVHVCAPPPGEGDPIEDPTTGRPLGPVATPPVPCRSFSPCGETLDGTFGPGPADWLALSEHQTTTSGGLTSVSGNNALHSRFALASADDMCKVQCSLLSVADSVG